MTVWSRAKGTVLDFPPAIPIDRFASPQRTGEPQTFKQAADTLFERHTRCSKLLANIRHIGSDANAEYKTTFRDLIESRHLVACDADRRACGTAWGDCPLLPP